MPRTKFSPFLHGFQFSNTFINDIAHIPGFGKVETAGRCGGMAAAALDYYFGPLAVPRTANLPGDGVPLADYIMQRQLQSFLIPSAINFISWSLYPDTPSWFAAGVNQWTRQNEFTKLKSQLDLGNPQVLGLVQARDIGHIGWNHQVVAYGYDVDPGGTISVYIYDVNTPNAETVLTLVPGEVGVRASNKGDGWRGFFVQGYGPQYPHYLLEGALVKEVSSPDVHVLYGGAKFRIPDAAEFKALKFLKTRIQDVPDGSLAYFADAPADGALLQERGQADLWVVYGGAKFSISGPAALGGLGLAPAALRKVPAGSLAALADVPRDRTLLRELSQAAPYVIQNGQRCLVPNAQAMEHLGLVYSNVRLVPDGAVAALPDGGMLA